MPGGDRGRFGQFKKAFGPSGIPVRLAAV